VIECLYCSERKPKEAFNREHVIPKAFGMFKHNLVIKIVCCECNSYFGRHLDIVLSRDSMEGVQRFESGFQKPKPDQRLGRGTRLKPTLRGEYEGAILEYHAPEDGSPGLVVEPIPQIGFGKTEKGPCQWYPLNEVPTLDELRKTDIGKEFWIRAWRCEPEVAKRVLMERGFNEVEIPPESEEVFAKPYSSVEISVSGVFDNVIARAVAKIAMNYLAHEYPSIARMAACQPVRRFIRYGEGHWQQFVAMTNDRMLKNVPADVQLFAHSVAATWERNPGRLLGQVSLYNWVQYKVLLADTFLVQPDFVRSGHLFEPSNQVVMRLTSKPQKMLDLTKHRRLGPEERLRPWKK